MPSVCRRRIDLPIRSQNLSTAENMCKARCPSLKTAAQVLVERPCNICPVSVFCDHSSGMAA